MKTLFSIVCLIVALSFSTAFAQTKDLSGCEELTWKQHISKVPFKMIKKDSDKLMDGTKMDVYVKEYDPSMAKHKEAMVGITYLFVDDCFAAVMYTMKDAYGLVGMLKIISDLIGAPDKMTADDEGRLQAVWIRPKTVAYLDSSDNTLMVGDIDAMVLIMKKGDGVNT